MSDERFILKNARHLAARYMEEILRPGDIAVDATMGNGKDTQFLCELVGETGHVYAFDVQEEALERTAARLEAAGLRARATLILAGHETMRENVPVSPRAVMFNLGWLPGGTYALYSDDTDVILTATRNGLSNDSTNPADWNGEANATKKDGPQVTYYRSLIYAAPTEYGKKLAEKVNNGEALTWEDLDGARWAVQKTSSSAGYIYPSMWLMANYDGKKISDLSNVIPLDSGYGTAFSYAAAEQVDIIVCYADGRNDYEASWMLPVDQKDETGKQGMGRSESIWNELNVIGVTEGIYNDTVAISKASQYYTPEIVAALQDCFINIINTEEGKAIFDVYSHTGYAKAVDSDYDGARAALKAVSE